MANSDFIFNLAFRTEGSEEIKQVQASLESLLASQQRITSTSRQQGTAQKSLTTQNRNLAQSVQDSVKQLDRERRSLKLGTDERAANERATASLQNSLNSLNTTNERYNSTVIGQQKRDQRRKEALIASAGATQKLEVQTKSFISSLGQSTSMTERNVNEATQLISKIDQQINSNQKLQRSVGLTRKQQASLVKEEQRLIKTKESLQNRVSGTANRFEQFKRSAAAARADLQRLSADNLRAGETTESHKEEQQRLEQVLQDLGIEFKMLSEAGELSEQQMTQMSSALAGVKGQALQTDRNLKGMSQAFTGQTKAVNSANQIMLSFSDIAQDSAQFQFGFAQGMRAIGNNISFAAEQFTIFASKVAVANNGTFTMRDGINTMKKALMGPAGLVVILSTAVTVITVLSEAMRKNKKEAENLAESSDFLTEAVDRQIKAFQDARKAQDDFYDTGSIQARMEAVSRRRDILENSLIPGLEKEIELDKQAIEETKNKISQNKTLYLQSLQREETEKLTRKEIQAEANLRKELISKGEILESTLEAQEASFPAQKKFLEDTINIRKQELKQTEDTIRQLNLEEKILGDINATKEEGGEIEIGNAVISQEQLDALRQRQQDERALEMFKAEQLGNERKRAEEIERLRVEDAEERLSFGEITEQNFTLLVLEAEQARRDAIREIRNKELREERERKLQLLEVEREHSQMRLSIERQLSESRQQVNQQLITSLQSSFSALFGQNKAVALLNLAVEKGLAIAKVIADAREKASDLQAEAAALRTKGAIAAMTGNPAQSAQFFAAATAATAGSVKTLATGKKNAVKIAAIGLLQGAGALGGGGGSSSGGGGGSSRGASQSQQQQTPLGFSQGPAFMPTSNQTFQPVQIKINNTVDRNGIVTLINDVEREISEDGIFLLGNQS